MNNNSCQKPVQSTQYSYLWCWFASFVTSRRHNGRLWLVWRFFWMLTPRSILSTLQQTVRYSDLDITQHVSKTQNMPRFPS